MVVTIRDKYARYLATPRPSGLRIYRLYHNCRDLKERGGCNFEPGSATPKQMICIISCVHRGMGKLPGSRVAACLGCPLFASPTRHEGETLKQMGILLVFDKGASERGNKFSRIALAQKRRVDVFV